MTAAKPVKAVKANEINDETEEVEKPKPKVAIDFDDLIATELDEVEDDAYKVFTYKGRDWKGAPNIGVGTIRKLVRAEARGDQMAVIGFLASVVDDPDWDDVVDKMSPAVAGIVANRLLALYSGDQGK